jgi:hypothetical protein
MGIHHSPLTHWRIGLVLLAKLCNTWDVQACLPVDVSTRQTVNVMDGTIALLPDEGALVAQAAVERDLIALKFAAELTNRRITGSLG